MVFVGAEGKIDMSLEEKILNELSKGNFTADEVQHKLGIQHQSNSAIFTKLKKTGLIEGTGVYRKTRLGRKAQVMQLTKPNSNQII